MSEEYYRGEKVYKEKCIICHNVNPGRPGSFGPDIAGAKLEVIRSMIMTGQPPKGVEPKWTDMEMAPLPHLKDEIPYIYEYLKSFN